MTKLTVEQINEWMDRGYRRVSNKRGTVARIDRPDWEKVEGMDEAQDLDEVGKEHFYRRAFSQDRVQLDRDTARKFHNSLWAQTGYVK